MRFSGIVIVLLAAAPPEISPAAAPDFVRDVRPLLEDRCFKCHGPEKQKGGLRFDSSAGALAPGESGEKAIVPGNSSASRLIKLVSSNKADEQMPPQGKGERLSRAEIDLLKRWIDAGASWPASTASSGPRGSAEMIVSDEDRKHWSFLPLQSPTPPSVRRTSTPRTPIDAFIVARLEDKKLTLSPLADARKLARRIYFDLVGLPPSPDQLKSFLAAHARNPRSAIEGLVDELLASPQYGERWGRHWLDVARYADSNGSESDADRPTAYHYRDFVIRALNEDMPFDAFARWQIAGDELEPDNPRAVAATGFIVGGTHAALPANLMEEERTRERFNELDDMIATTGSALLGLTLACTRCHDHKYDPIPTRDYYRLQSAFNGGDRAEVPLATISEIKRHRETEAKWKKESDLARKRLDELVKTIRQAHAPTARRAKIDALKIEAAEKALLQNEPDQPAAKKLAEKFAKELKVQDSDLRELASASEKDEWSVREKALKAIEGRKPKSLPTAYGFADFGASPRPTFLLARGDFHAKKEPLDLGFLTVLTRGRSPSDYWSAARTEGRRPDSTQQRRALATWMTDIDHGAGTLVARVIVNRVWQHHFGEGLVRTVNDFGSRCDPPTHPELLEWLTHEFVQGGWRLKPLHRLIMTSAVYLQDNESDAARSRIDPDNRLHWRHRPQRMESEILRDSILAVSGALNPEMFGPAFKSPIAAEAIQARNMKDPYPKDLKDTPATHRRSVYMFHKRVVQQPLMQAFDGPDAQASCGRRVTTTVAPQALALLNDRFIRARAEDLARRLVREAGEEPSAQVRFAWTLALARKPSARELKSSVEFIRSQGQRRAARPLAVSATPAPSAAPPAPVPVPGAEARHQALADFCQAMFAMNEFVYVD